MSSALRRLLVSTVILILPVAILAGAWRLGGVSALEDDLIFYLPTRQYIAERIHAGEFPLWNPLVAMGTSLPADPQSGLWYPATYLFLLLPPLVAYPVSLVLHFALAGGGMYRFLRASRRDWRAALLGAVAFEFCGYLVAHRAHLTIHHAVAWIPWILYGWRRFADTGRIKYAVLASTAFGIQLLVQHVQISIITAALLTGYVAVVLVQWRSKGPMSCSSGCHGQAEPYSAQLARGRRPGSALLRKWWIYPAGMTAGAMLAGIQLVPTWLHYAGSARGAPSYYLFNENSWLPTSATMLLFPMLMGARTPNSLWTERWWGPSHFCEQSAYASILILMLAAASLRLVRMPSPFAGDQSLGRQLARGWQFLRVTSPRILPRLWGSSLFECTPEGAFLARMNLRHKLWLALRQDTRDALRLLPRGWNREAAFWWGACLVALLIALGDLTPVSKWLFHLPAYRSLRVPARWILVWSVAMPVLASMVVSALLRGKHDTRRIVDAVQFTVMRALPVAAAVCLLLLAVAAYNADHIAAAFPGPRSLPKVAGLMLASRLGNAAIWWPLLIMAITAWSLLRWVHARRTGAFVLMFCIFLADISAVAGLVDVDVQTYSRRDVTRPPPLAVAIRNLDPRAGDRLLVPRIESDYDRPLEVLWPQSNLRYDIATFNGYGPLWPVGSRMLFRFMPWGSSEEILALLRNGSLLRAMGVRFIAVRSAEERELLRRAQLPSLSPGKPLTFPPLNKGGALGFPPLGKGRQGGVAESDDHLPGSEQLQPVRYAHDLLWGPVSIREPGIYELSCDVVPLAGTTSRWFVRLEVPSGAEVDRTRTLEPADMVSGPRRMRFLYHFGQPVPALRVRIKSEIGEALSAGRAILRQVAVELASGDRPATGNEPFIHRDDLPGHVSLYEVPGTRPLVYWAEQVEVVPDLVTAIDRIEARVADGSKDSASTILECPSPGVPVPVAHDGRVRFSRPASHELNATASSASGGLMVFTESHDPGWRATVDGREASIMRVNAVCQGVIVPSGEHEIRFSYLPPGLKLGAAVSLIGALLLTTGLVASTRKRQTPHTA